MENWSVHHLFEKSLETLGSDSALNLIQYAKYLQRKKLPIIFTLRHLSQITNVDYSMLKNTVMRNREAANYKMFAIKKRSGGRRYIHSVSKDLFQIHQFINTEILKKCYVHHASYAFHSNGGIYACALSHCKARWLFQYDLKDFFYSINEIDV